MAKEKGVAGWHSMRKDELVKALLKVAKKKAKAKSGAGRKKVMPPKATSKPGRVSKSTAASQKTKQSDSAIAKKIRIERERQENLKNLSSAVGMARRNTPPEKDRVILIVRDSFWLQAYWEVTRATVQRAKVAMTGLWHNAKPVLRLLEITSDGNTNSVEKVVQEIEIHSGVNNWYVNITEPGKNYRIAIGYTAPGEKFHLISKSNQVCPPPGSSPGGEHWTDITNDVEKYYALSGGHDPRTVSVDLQEVFEEKVIYET